MHQTVQRENISKDWLTFSSQNVCLLAPVDDLLLRQHGRDGLHQQRRRQRRGGLPRQRQERVRRVSVPSSRGGAGFRGSGGFGQRKAVAVAVVDSGRG